MHMSFSIDPGSAFDLKKIHELAGRMMKDYPKDTRLRTIRTIVRRISQEAKIDITDEKK